MSSVASWRPTVGPAQKYKGHTITVHPMAPDVIAAVDGQALPNFYLTAEWARQAGMRFIDQREDENRK